MKKTRILIVDDAVVVRKVLSEIIDTDPFLEVAGLAFNGKEALEKLPVLKPDIVILDVEMPEVDGLQTLAQIRKIEPKLPVIMFSTLTRRGASATLDALALGANDYITKPSNTGSLKKAFQQVRLELLPKIRVFCPLQERQLPESRPSSLPPKDTSATKLTPQSTMRARAKDIQPSTSLTSPSPPPAKRKISSFQQGTIDIVAVGVSTGGPNALSHILTQLPANFPVPIVIVQHMPPVFTDLLAQRLNEKCNLSVREAAEETPIKPGEVWIAPGDHHMIVKRSGVNILVSTNQDPLENSCRPAVDVLFRSVSEVFGRHTLAVVLTGMGQDGLKSCHLLHDKGAFILTQDQPSSVVWGMPGSVTKAGLANDVLPLDQIGKKLLSLVQQGRARPLPKSKGNGLK